MSPQNTSLKAPWDFCTGHMGLLKGEWVLLRTPWLSSQWISSWMGITESQLVKLLPVHCPSSNCHLLVFNFQQSHNEGVFLYQAGWITDLCIHSSCRKCPLLRKSMLRIPGASEPVTIQCFCHLSPVKLTSASNTDNSWHPLVTPEIQMGSTLLCLDGITNTHQLSAKALYLCGSNPHSPGCPVIPFPLLAKGRDPLFLFPVRVFWHTFEMLEVPSPWLKEAISVLLCLGDHWWPSCLSMAITLTAFLGDPFWTALFPLSSQTQASSSEVDSPSHCLMSPCSPAQARTARAHNMVCSWGFPSLWLGQERCHLLGCP